MVDIIKYYLDGDDEKGDDGDDENGKADDSTDAPSDTENSDSD
jgi:hypothetical protein